MDMDVDTEVLICLQRDLEDCRKSLHSASDNLSNAVSSAGQSLEGKQYALSVQETESSCKIIEASSHNLSQMTDYLCRLERDVNMYLDCKYNG